MDELRRELARARGFITRMDRVQEMSGIGTWEIDLGTGTSIWSAQVYRLIGAEPGTFEREPERFLDYVLPEDRPLVDELNQQWMADGDVLDTRVRFVRPDGAVRHLAFRSVLEKDEAGQPVAMSGSIRDVTERLEAATALDRANAELAQHSALLAEAERIAGIGSWSADLSTGRLNWSPQMRRILRADQSWMLEPTVESYLSIVHADDIERVGTAIEKTARTGEDCEIEHRVILPPGEQRSLLIRGRAQKVDGVVSGIIGVVEDVTETRERERELVRTRDLFQRVLSAGTAQAIIGCDRRGRIEIFNRGAERMLGYTAHEMIGSDKWLLLHDPAELEGTPLQAGRLSDVRTAWPELEQVIGSRDEWTYVRKDGRRLTVELSMTPMQDQDGTITGLLVVATDVTQARELARAQAEARRELEEAQRIAGVGSLTIDLIGGNAEWSSQMYRIFGADRATFVPTTEGYLSFVREADRHRIQGIFGAAIAAAGAYEFEHTIVRADGAERVLWERGQAEADENGRPIRMTGTAQDVTEARRIEGELIEARDLFQQLLSAATEQAIIGVDQDGLVTVFNRGAERMLGYDATEMLGKTPWSRLRNDVDLADIAGGREADAVYVETTHRGAGDGSNRTTLPGDQEDRTWICKDGTSKTVQTALTPMRDRTGEVTGFLCVATDVTERRRAEEARDRAEGEVRAAMEELERTRDEALAANHAKSAFLATMSHEIRTPMNAVIGMTGLLLDTELDEDQQDLLETVRGSGDQLLAIINDILDFSKIEAGDLDLEVRAFDLRDLVEGTVAQFASTAKGLDLITHVSDDCPASVLGDVTRLRQVLSNLISNAIKFTSAGDVLVHVTRLEEDGDKVNLMFAVRDTGIGIPAGSMHRLFKSFSQVDASTTRVYGGTGLGLAISRALVTAMGGDIWVESELGAGTTFSFSVQLGRDSEGAGAKAGVMDALTLRASLAGRRVLVVDDNATNRRILSMQLSSFGAAAIEAQGAVEALQLLGERGQHFDLAVLDLVMPVLDGVQLAGAIRRTRGLEHLPVILLSSLGRRLQADEEELFVAVLTKPVRSVPLMESFARAIEESAAQAPPRLPVEGEVAAAQRFPLSPPAAAGEAPRVAMVPAPGGPREAAGLHVSVPVDDLRILLAEDNEVNQKVGRLMLAKLGYRTEIVGNGELALEAAREHDYDVILMDMHMPVMDGLEATRHIRAELPASRQPIIIAMTASVTKEDRDACAEAGMNDYLSKPVRPGQLAALLGQVQDTARPRPL